MIVKPFLIPHNSPLGFIEERLMGSPPPLERDFGFKASFSMLFFGAIRKASTPALFGQMSSPSPCYSNHFCLFLLLMLPPILYNGNLILFLPPDPPFSLS